MLKQLLLFPILVFTVCIAYAQSYEEKIARKACECLEEKPKPTEDTYKDCIISSMSSTYFSDTSKAVKQKINTAESIKDSFKKVHEYMPIACQELKMERYEERKKSFYADSENKVAQSYFITTQDMMEEGKYDQAIEGLKIAVKEDPKFVKAYDHLAICYRRLEKFDDAIKYYKKSLDIFPEGDLALMNLGVIYTFKSNYKEALKCYQTLLEYAPNHVEGYFGAGKSYFLLEDYANALDHIFIAHKLYIEKDSPYKEDSKKIIQVIYNSLKEKGQTELFNNYAEKHHIKITK